MTPENERERRAVADLLELAGPKPGETFRDHRNAILGGLVSRNLLVILAALRDQPTSSADPGTAGRDAGAAEMRERCLKLVSEHSYNFEGLEDQNGLAGMFARGNRNAKRRLDKAIRALPIRPDHQPETTEGGADAE